MKSKGKCIAEIQILERIFKTDLAMLSLRLIEFLYIEAKKAKMCIPKNLHC